MRIIVAICFLGMLSSCHTSRNIATTHVNTDSIVQRVTDSVTQVQHSQEEYYKSVIKDLQSYDVTFEPCPDSDSMMAILDSIGKLNYARMIAKPTRITVNKDGSFEAEGVKRALISKSLVTEQFRAFREWSDSILQVRDAQITSLNKEVNSKVKVVERSYIPTWIWFLIAGLAVGTFGLGWWRSHSRLE